MLPRLLASAVAFVSLAAPLAAPSPARAQDASFGCKVLLCAAATAPGWAGIPYCVPVMQELFRQLALRRPWPVCSEARTSAIGFALYPSPTGWTQVDGDDGLAALDSGLRANLSASTRLCGPAEGAICKTAFQILARSGRPNSNLVNSTIASGTQRVHFALERD